MPDVLVISPNSCNLACRIKQVMRETGHDLPSLYKETAGGGLAKKF